jgi:hypothetical protein
MRVVLVSLCLAVLALAPAAQAAQRYAVPEGSGPEPCSAAAPCSLKEALEKAKSSDEVILAPGTYEVDASIAPKPGVENVYVHGSAGGPMPLITAKTGINPPIGGGSGGRLGYLDIVNEASNAFGVFCAGGGVERVRVRVVGGSAIGISARPGCTVRDSVVQAAGSGAKGLEAGSSSGDSSAAVRNVTAIAAGPGSVGIASSFGLNPFGGVPGTFTLDLKNAIASGGKADLEAADTLGFGGAAILVVAHSNFDFPAVGTSGTIVDGGGNQAAPPLYVDAPAGNYREAAGSPTIDAGIDDLLGPTDFDGNARAQGSAPDIGAFEVVVPPGPPPAPLVGQIQSLAVAPKAFRAAHVGPAILSARNKAKAPVSATVTYSLSAAATVSFTVDRKLAGRKAGKRCVKKTKANEERKKCPLFKPVKGGFAHSGAVGANRFRFSGRLAKALAPGSYRLTGRTATASRATNFRIVR